MTLRACCFQTLLFLGATGGAAVASAQSSVVNYEPGAVMPIATSSVELNGATRQLLFVCNTPDNRLEIFDAEPPHKLLGRVPTGLAPVTVRLRKTSDTEILAYTCNLIGDSVTTAGISATGVTGSGRVLIRARLNHTNPVGDEPNDIAFVKGDSEAIVSLRSRSAVSILDADTMEVIPGQERHLVQRDAGPFNIALKHPSWMQALGDRLLILDRSSDLDRLDLFIAESSVVGGNPLLDPAANVTRRFSGGMGNTRFAAAVNSSGSQLFVVGTLARSEVIEEDVLMALPTGFVQSWMWVVDIPTGGGAQVHPEAVPGTQPAPLPSINLNRDYSAPGLVGVAPIDALAQPTGISLVEDASGNVVRVVLSAFSSDKLAVLTPDSSAPSGWQIQQTKLSISTGPQSGYSMVGPRGVALNANLTAPGAPQSGVAFVANTLDNSVSVFDPFGVTELTRFQLPSDSTAQVVRAGREFLYGAKHSGNQAGSCSSCHIDGHTDGIAWDLSTPAMDGPLITSPEVDKPLTFVGTPFPGDKGPMMTQTLRGLVNYHIEGEGQVLATNAPYHWRGDRPTFQDFGPAFMGLLGGPMLPAEDMDAFTDFIETLPHPPNPEQPRSRSIEGDLGTLLSSSSGPYYDSGSGSGAARGLKLYHVETSVGELSCVHCHSTPDGSNNRITEGATFHGTINNPLETAALRHLFDREALVLTDFSLPAVSMNDSFDDTDVRAKVHGLFHHPDRTLGDGGFGRSINQFTGHRFLNFMPGPSAMEKLDQVEDLIEFMRTLDTGSAPVIGLSDQLSASFVSTDIKLMIEQAGEANCDVVVWVGLNGIAEGWWLDVANGTYRKAGTNQQTTIQGLQSRVSSSVLGGSKQVSGSPMMSTGTQKAVASGAVVVEFQAVPVGTGRTIASGGKAIVPLTGPAPSNVTLEPMAMGTAWARSADFAGNWSPGHAGNPFSGGLLPSHAANLALEQALIDELALSGLDLGVQSLLHEPPRRLRVAGDDLRYGARLRIEMPETGGGSVAVELPLFATDHMTSAPVRRIWETEVELDGEISMALLNGGIFLDHVQEVRDFEPPSSPLDPAADNFYTITVINEDASSFGPFTERLRVSRDR